ncbi:MAG: deoxyribodipyrimidine photo-lyase [Desulfovermiculus sp.]|nr:deoxyribodipyrimidine photo-lyase [Desulfovermiculus sp.]
MDPRRIQTLHNGFPGTGPVIYWMSRDQRIQDNWALLYAQKRALEAGRGLVILFTLQPEFLQATWRQYHFMLRGLQETAQESRRMGIPFVLRLGNPPKLVSEFARDWDAQSLVCDFDPLRIKSLWRQEVRAQITFPLYMVDAHNIVPCWETSDKQEYAARTIRPKIQKRLFDFLSPFPQLQVHPHPIPDLNTEESDWEGVKESLHVDPGIRPVQWLKPGFKAAARMLEDFLDHKLQNYSFKSNDPNAEVLSNLSPYLHFGQMAPQRAVLEIQARQDVSSQAREAFLEQIIIRRELADNYCRHNSAYDSFAGLPEWAQSTLNAHRSDPRPVLYSREELEAAATHDQLWNAAQNQMIFEGKMHGYMRMYWAKKILEWTESPEQAISWALYLNDRYELDGRDPNGYVGVLWSIGGLHDHGFKQRSIFGTVRYMSYAGCKRKFDVQAYISRYSPESG